MISQHPRDLFDVKLLLENEGFTDAIRRTFLVYLISHNRPIAELLQPTRKDMQSLYHGEFASMTAEPVSLGELEAVRETLVESIHAGLTADERRFLLGFKAMQPDWSLLGLNGVETLPAVRWKLHNLAQLPSHRHADLWQRLADIIASDSTSE